MELTIQISTISEEAKKEIRILKDDEASLNLELAVLQKKNMDLEAANAEAEECNKVFKNLVSHLGWERNSIIIIYILMF